MYIWCISKYACKFVCMYVWFLCRDQQRFFSKRFFSKKTFFFRKKTGPEKKREKKRFFSKFCFFFKKNIKISSFILAMLMNKWNIAIMIFCEAICVKNYIISLYKLKKIINMWFFVPNIDSFEQLEIFIQLHRYSVKKYIFPKNFCTNTLLLVKIWWTSGFQKEFKN